MGRFSKTFPYDTRWGFSSESEMYWDIWNDRPHVSFISGYPIHGFNPACFLHVLPKGLNQYPHFRFNPNNVVLGTYREHFLFDQGSKHQREKYKKEIVTADWDKLYRLREDLLQQYNKLFKGQ